MGINFEMWDVYIVEGIAENNLGIVQNMKITDLTAKTLRYTFTDTGEKSRDTFENFNKRWKVIEEIPRYNWGYQFAIDELRNHKEPSMTNLAIEVEYTLTKNKQKVFMVDKTKEILQEWK